MVVICLLMAMVEVIPSRTNYRAQEVAELMFEHVYKHHGLPKQLSAIMMYFLQVPFGDI